MKVLHILHRSVPGAHGYAIRSKEIVSHLMAKGIESLVVTSPSQAPLGNLDSESSELIDGVRYFRSCGKLVEPTIEVKDGKYARATVRVLQNINLLRMALRIAKKYKPDGTSCPLTFYLWPGRRYGELSDWYTCNLRDARYLGGPAHESLRHGYHFFQIQGC